MRKNITQKSTYRFRNAPVQERSAATIGNILKAAAIVLNREGIERLSTNLVCHEANVTPPALYRYFPDKYALLEELGIRLMDRQNALLESDGMDFFDLENSIYHMLVNQHQVTLEVPAGTAIMRSLRAIPRLTDVRIKSNMLAAGIIARKLHHAFPAADISMLEREARLGIELGYAALEFLFDEPHAGMEATLRRTAKLLTAQIGMIAEEVSKQPQSI